MLPKVPFKLSFNGAWIFHTFPLWYVHMLVWWSWIPVIMCYCITWNSASWTGCHAPSNIFHRQKLSRSATPASGVNYKDASSSSSGEERSAGEESVPSPRYKHLLLEPTICLISLEIHFPLMSSAQGTTLYRSFSNSVERAKFSWERAPRTIVSITSKQYQPLTWLNDLLNEDIARVSAVMVSVTVQLQLTFSSLYLFPSVSLSVHLRLSHTENPSCSA